jgi:hypothetical protein
MLIVRPSLQVRNVVWRLGNRGRAARLLGGAEFCHQLACFAYNPGFRLFSRAWALQEEVLAPRVLYFGPNELLFQC